MKTKQRLLLVFGIVMFLTGCSQSVMNVTLGEMSVELDRSVLIQGPVTIQIKNNGRIDHQVVIIKTDLPADQLAADPSQASIAAEDGKVGEIENIEPGASAKLELDLAPGNYVVICNKPGHYMAGMFAGFTVE